MKKLFSILIVAALTAALAVTAVGCKSTGGNDDSNSAGNYGKDIPGGVGDVSAETLQALSQSGTVSVYQFSEPDEEDEAFEDYFSEVYGGTLDKRNIVWEGWEAQFITQFAAGDAPDVIYLYSKLWPRAASRGLVYSKADLEQLGVAALDHPVITNSAELASNNFTYAGNVYAMDVYLVTPNVMLVNDTLLKDCGVEKTPTQYYQDGQWNWDSFLKVMAQVCSIDNDADGKPDYRGYNGWDPTYVLSGNDGHLIKYDDNGKLFANTSDTKVINGLQMYNDVISKNYCIERGSFQDGKTATYVETHYNVAKRIYNEGNKLGFDWSVVPYPLGPDNETGSMPGGCEAYAVVSSTQNPQGAINYIIAKSAFKSQYVEEKPDYDLEYWLDDEGDQMLNDLRLKIHERTWNGVGNVWSTQWDFWNAARNTKSVSELLSAWGPWMEAQCEVENSYSAN